MKISTLAKCKECGHEFTINNSNVFKRNYEVLLDGQSITLTYFDCPKCNKRHFVQIDNAKTINLLNEIELQMSKLTSLKKRGRVIPKKQSAKFERSRKYLAKIRKNLIEDFKGKKIIDKSSSGLETIHTLNFVDNLR